MEKIKWIVSRADFRNKEKIDDRCISFVATFKYTRKTGEIRTRVVDLEYIELNPEELVEFIKKHGRSIISPAIYEYPEFPGEKLGSITIYDYYVE
jgi:hypothetical protein